MNLTKVQEHKCTIKDVPGVYRKRNLNKAPKGHVSPIKKQIKQSPPKKKKKKKINIKPAPVVATRGQHILGCRRQK